MAPTPVRQPAETVTDTHRRDAVLESALLTFARYGYRKTSMEQIAQVAHISRPGLYFLFDSKQNLFRAAVTRALQTDIATIERILASTDQPLTARLLDSFDEWAGRYVGPLARDISTVIESNPDLLGAITVTAPGRFQELIINALAAERGLEAAQRIGPTLISTSIGIKHQVDTREDYRVHLDVAITLLVGS